MTKPRTLRMAGALALALGACSSGRTAPGGASPEPARAHHSDSAAIARVRADSTRNPYTGADIHFMSAMIGHHSQALVMAGWAPTHGAGAAVRRLAERIINGQQDEIATMQQWLRDRGKPVPDQDRMATMHPAPGLEPSGSHGAGHGSGEHEMQMPGMLTEAQLRQLDATKGAEFDRLFLTFMIQHHRGAVSMVQTLFGTRGAAHDETVFKFANDVSVDQSTEIARMESMLEALGPASGSP